MRLWGWENLQKAVSRVRDRAVPIHRVSAPLLARLYGIPTPVTIHRQQRVLDLRVLAGCLWYSCVTDWCQQKAGKHLCYVCCFSFCFLSETTKTSWMWIQKISLEASETLGPVRVLSANQNTCLSLHLHVEWNTSVLFNFLSSLRPCGLFNS